MEITVKFLTVKDVSELLKLSRSTIYEAFPVGRFPKPEKFGKASRWRVDNLEEFIELCKVMLAKPKPPRKDKGKAQLKLENTCNSKQISGKEKD